MGLKNVSTLASVLALNALFLQGCGVTEPSDGFEVSSSFASGVARNSIPRIPNLGSETRSTPAPSPAPAASGFTNGGALPVGYTAYIQPGGGLSVTPAATPRPSPAPTQVVVVPIINPAPAATPMPAPVVSGAIGGATPVAGMPAPLSDTLNQSVDCQHMLSYLGWNTSSLNATEISASGLTSYDYDSKMINVGDRTYSSSAIGITLLKYGSPRPGAAQNEIRIFGMYIQNSKLALRLRDVATGKDISVPASAYTSTVGTWYPSGKPVDEPIRFITSDGYDRLTGVSLKLSREFYEANLKNASNTVTADLYCSGQLISSSALDITSLKTDMRGVLVKKSMLPSYDLVYEN